MRGLEMSTRSHRSLIDVRKLPVFQSSNNINAYERNVGTGIVSKQLVV